MTKLLKVECLLYAVEKQPSTPVINLGKKWALNLQYFVRQ